MMQRPAARTSAFCIASFRPVARRLHAHSTTHIACRSGEVTSNIILGEVVMAHVHPGLTADSESERAGKGPVVDFAKYQPVSRLGGDTYARVTETYDLPRPEKRWQDDSADIKASRDYQGGG